MQGLTSIGKHNILVEWLLFRLGCCNWLTAIGKLCTAVSCLVLEFYNRTVSVAIVIVWRAACSADGVKKFLFMCILFIKLCNPSCFYTYLCGVCKYYVLFYEFCCDGCSWSTFSMGPMNIFSLIISLSACLVVGLLFVVRFMLDVCF